MGGLFLNIGFTVGICERVVAPCVSKVPLIPKIIVKTDAVAIFIGVRGKGLILYFEYNGSSVYLVTVLDGYVLSRVLIYAIGRWHRIGINAIVHCEFWYRWFRY